jgi:hypothetical protein
MSRNEKMSQTTGLHPKIPDGPHLGLNIGIKTLYPPYAAHNP